MSFLIRILKTIRQYIALIILKLSGWKNKKNIAKDIKKAVMIGAPHTSYWDSFWLVLYGFAYLPFNRIYALFKIEANKSFWGKFYRLIGGIPIDRNKETREKKISIVQTVSQKIKQMDECILILAPEGTRKYTNKWKTGFYYIALEANVPILLAKMDYKTKEYGIYKAIYPTGNFEADMKKINEFYINVTAKYPKKFSIHNL